jgi:DNA replication and repair protein RecF
MELQQLFLHNFRNYSQQEVRFVPGINLIIGENAQGKTNLLEAINYLSLVRSHRTGRDGELLKWDQENFNLRGEIKKKNGILNVAVNYENNRKTVYINNNKITKFSELLGLVNTVLFTPEDLVLAKGSPSYRRRFLDQFISQVNYKYFYSLQSYHRILKQKNNSLKQKIEKKTMEQMVQIWNEQLVESGAELILARIILLEKLNKLINLVHYQISGEREKIRLVYHPSIDLKAEDVKNQALVKERYWQLLKQNQRLEEIKKVSLVGPHRDDFLFLINGKDLKIFGSQGQQRTAVLSLKIAQLELMKEITGEYPLLLLDDVFSELDELRRRGLLNYINNKVQTFITNAQTLGEEKSLCHKKFIIRQGKITE